MTAPPGAADDADGLILFAHGARDPAWARPFEQVAAAVRAARPGVPLALAYLELMTPDLATAGRSLAESGCRCVVIVPLFLGAGGHVRRDLPERVAQLQRSHPGVTWRLAPAIGENPEVLHAIAAAAAAATGGTAR